MRQKMLVLFAIFFVADAVLADLKGQSHLHSVFSDGFLTPRGICLQAVERGVKWLVPLDHGNGVSRIDNPIKEIDLQKRDLGAHFVGIDKYLATWEDLAKEFNLVIIPGLEYEIKHKLGAYHLGVVPVTKSLHEAMLAMLADSVQTPSEKVKRAFSLIREHNALPLVTHPTLKMVHPESLKKIGDDYKVTDYSFPRHLWQNEPFLLLEALNHGNLDKPEDLALLVGGNTALVAGCDFHTWKAETMGAIIGNRLLGRPSQFPIALDRFTWISTDRDNLSAAEILQKLRQGETYLSYGKAKFDLYAESVAALKWKDVDLEELSFQVPIDWKPSLAGYHGNGPRGQEVELQVMPRKYDNITISSASEFFHAMADDRQTARLFNTEFTQSPQFSKLTIDWQEGDGQYRRVIVVKLNRDNQAWLVDIYSTRSYDLFQRAFFDRITKTLKPA